MEMVRKFQAESTTRIASTEASAIAAAALFTPPDPILSLVHRHRELWDGFTEIEGDPAAVKAWSVRMRTLEDELIECVPTSMEGAARILDLVFYTSRSGHGGEFHDALLENLSTALHSEFGTRTDISGNRPERSDAHHAAPAVANAVREEQKELGEAAIETSEYTADMVDQQFLNLVEARTDLLSAEWVSQEVAGARWKRIEEIEREMIGNPPTSRVGITSALRLLEEELIDGQVQTDTGVDLARSLFSSILHFVAEARGW